MRKNIIFSAILLVFTKCACHQPGHPSLLGGLLIGAHDLRNKVHDVLGGLAQGALNLEGHIEVNRVQPGYQNQPQPFQGGYRPGKPADTIVVVVETEGRPHHHHHEQGGHRPPPPGNGPHYHDRPNYPNRPEYGYGQHNNGPYNDNNNYNKPQDRPGYGYNPQGQNFNGNPYTNNGNFDQNNYGRPPNNDNYNHNHDSKPQFYGNGDYTKNNNGSPPPNTGNYNENNVTPNENFDQNCGTNPPVFINKNDENHYGNIPTNPPPFDKPQDGFPDQNEPRPEFTTKQPEKNTQYGSIYDVNKENANNIPTRKPDFNVNNNEHTSKKPDDDASLFVPLNPNQYQYGGEKIEVNAPKRETNPNPAEEDDNKSYPIDIRFGDE